MVEGNWKKIGRRGHFGDDGHEDRIVVKNCLTMQVEDQIYVELVK